LKRGDLVIVFAAGDYGKPRPAVVIQSDRLKATDSVLVALLTTTLADAALYRFPIEPNAGNGLNAPSQVMVDKIVAMPREKCGRTIGRIERSELIALNQMLSLIIGIVD